MSRWSGSRDWNDHRRHRRAGGWGPPAGDRVLRRHDRRARFLLGPRQDGADDRTLEERRVFCPRLHRRRRADLANGYDWDPDALHAEMKAAWLLRRAAAAE